jgi:hypothetical protein
MKIHYEWEAKDVDAGIHVRQADGRGELMLIGYANWKTGPVKYVMIALSDGAVYGRPTNKTALAAELTKYNYMRVNRDDRG